MVNSICFLVFTSFFNIYSLLWFYLGVFLYCFVFCQISMTSTFKCNTLSCNKITLSDCNMIFTFELKSLMHDDRKYHCWFCEVWKRRRVSLQPLEKCWFLLSNVLNFFLLSIFLVSTLIAYLKFKTKNGGQ